MFKLQSNPTFWTKVDIPSPGGESQVLEVEFRHKGRSDAVKFAEALGSRPTIDSLREIVVDWKGADGPFSAAALAELDEDRMAAAPRLIEVYLDELKGARRKN